MSIERLHAIGSFRYDLAMSDMNDTKQNKTGFLFAGLKRFFVGDQMPTGLSQLNKTEPDPEPTNTRPKRKDKPVGLSGFDFES